MRTGRDTGPPSDGDPRTGRDPAGQDPCWLRPVLAETRAGRGWRRTRPCADRDPLPSENVKHPRPCTGRDPPTTETVRRTRPQTDRDPMPMETIESVCETAVFLLDELNEVSAGVIEYRDVGAAPSVGARVNTTPRPVRRACSLAMSSTANWANGVPSLLKAPR